MVLEGNQLIEGVEQGEESTALEDLRGMVDKLRDMCFELESLPISPKKWGYSQESGEYELYNRENMLHAFRLINDALNLLKKAGGRISSASKALDGCVVQKGQSRIDQYITQLDIQEDHDKTVS